LLTHPLSIALVLSWCAASAARASCTIELRGNPQIVEAIAPVLASFGDDSGPCVNVHVLCSQDGGDLVLDLLDQLGRSAERRFSTTEGAAAFLVSWSRHPMPQDGTRLELLPPGATPPTSPPAGDPRHGELRIAYSGAPIVSGWWAGLEGALVWNRGSWRLGAVVRGLASSWDASFMNGDAASVLLGAEAEATFGAESTFGRISFRQELAVGASYVTILSKQGDLYFQTAGPHGGIRAAVGYEVIPRHWLELSGGWDALLEAAVSSDVQYRLSSPNRILDQAHLEIGLRWAL